MTNSHPFWNSTPALHLYAVRDNKNTKLVVAAAVSPEQAFSLCQEAGNPTWNTDTARAWCVERNIDETTARVMESKDL